MNWFCVYSKACREFEACKGLKQRGFSVYMPIAKKVKRMKNQNLTIEYPLLPRYLFIKLDFRWDDLHAVAAVQEILPHEFEPVAVPEKDITRLQTEEAAGKFVFSDTATSRKRERKVLRSLQELAIFQNGAIHGGS